MSKVRERYINKYEPAYKRKFKWLDRCLYCGDKSTCQDHVFPISLMEGLEYWRPSVKEILGQGLNTVPSCRECNGIAGNTPFTSILKKRKYIKDILYKKYHKKIKKVEWDEDDISDLGYNLITHICYTKSEKDRIVNRLFWPQKLKIIR